MNHATRIQELERASDGLRELTSQRDGLQVELAAQVSEVAGLRARLEASQQLATQRDRERTECRQLVDIARESLNQLATRLS